MESLTAPVVELVLTDEASAITLQTVAGDNVLLSHLHAKNGVGIVHSVLGAKESMLGSIACLLERTIVRLELASRTKLVLLSNHLLVLGGRRHSDHGLHSTLTLATHENTLLAVANLPGSHLAQRLGIALKGMVRPLLSGIQITVGPSDGA